MYRINSGQQFGKCVRVSLVSYNTVSLKQYVHCGNQVSYGEHKVNHPVLIIVC